MVPSDPLARISPTGSVPCSAPGQAEALDGQRFLESLPVELAQFRAQVKAFAAAGAVSARSSPDRPAAAGWR